MKHTQLLLVLAFLFIKATSMGQCTTPPVLNYINSNYLEKCGDYYSGTLPVNHNITASDSTTYTLNIFNINDTNQENTIYAETKLISSTFYFTNEHIPSLGIAFIAKVLAENNCGKDSLVRTIYFNGNNTRSTIPDTSTCEGYIPSYITGPTELTSCDKDATYRLHTPMYDSIGLPLFFSWYMKGNGTTLNLGGRNIDSLYLHEIPPYDFKLFIEVLDSCGCSGFHPNFTNTLTTLDINIEEDSLCGSINGEVYVDKPSNCFNEEYKIPRRAVKLSDAYYTFSNNNGYYNANFYFGNYNVALAPQQGETDCNTSPFNITLDANNPAVTQDLHAVIDEAHMFVSIQASRARVGRTNAGSVYLENRYFDQTNRELTLTWPNEVTMGNINPSPTSITGNVVRWSNIDMDAFERKYFNFEYTLNQGVDIGDEVRWYATLEGQTDYIDSTTTLVVNSYDPNEVIVNKTAVLDTELNKKLKYTVHFQNTGNDTAYLVRVIDTLDAKLDMATLAVLGASHDFEFDIVSGNVMQWTFPAINLLDSTSNEEKSKGWFQFFVDFKDDVVVNDFAESTAHIYFDTNEPITTNTAITTITNNVSIQEYGAITFSLHPNPATSELFVTSNASISSYHILSIDGRMVKQGQNISNNQAISVQELPRGIYYLKIADTNGQIAVQPFEKM